MEWLARSKRVLEVSRADKLLLAVSDYVEAMGWDVVVVSIELIQGSDRDISSCNYELVIRFTSRRNGEVA